MRNRNKNYLTNCILETLEQEELSPNLKEALLTSDGNEVAKKTEGELWDYKETIEFSDPVDVSKLATRVLAFHNNKGGVLIFGIGERGANYKIVGFPTSKILDNSRIIDKLRKYIGLQVPIFQDRILLHGNYAKSLWFIFIKGRGIAPPKPILKDSPDNGKRFKRGQYFIRINDEIKKCTDPLHFERLFSGTSLTHIKAYSHEVDKPYFRLLSPHTQKFIGREEKKKEAFELLDSRYFIISLDGPGGVGKSALAIEVIKTLYNSLEYDFIISLSAKNKVWVGHSKTKQSDFSGFAEFLREIATVLCIDKINKTTDDLEKEILDYIKGSKGVILIDNIEEVTDQNIFHFIKQIPHPVKVIVTSRVSKDLGAVRIDVPKMTKFEAKQLFKYELRFHNYYGYKDEEIELENIINACGYLPLAIKWAASFINNSCKNLRDIYAKIKQMDATKKEFLDYIFSTMYDELSPTAKEVALLSIYLNLEDWTEVSCSIILEKEEREIVEAISELEDKDILIVNGDSTSQMNMLPITVQFLKQKWHENRTLRLKVGRAIDELVPIDDGQTNIFDLPINERLEKIYWYTKQLEDEERYSKASKLIRLTRQWLNHKDLDESISVRLHFREGKIIYLNDRDKENGILRMKWALEGKEQTKELSEEWVFLAIALMNFGRQSDEKDALQILENHLGSTDILIKEFSYTHFERFFNKRKFQLIIKGLSRIKSPKKAYDIYKGLKVMLQINTNIKALGSNIENFFDLAKKYKKCTEKDILNIENLKVLYRKGE